MTMNGWPKGVAAPARRALEAAGYSRPDDLTDVREDELLQLHGMGRKAVEALRAALAEKGMSFRDAKRGAS